QPKGKDFESALSVRVVARFRNEAGDNLGEAEIDGSLVLPGIEGNDTGPGVALELEPFQIVPLTLSADVPEGATEIRLRISGRDRTDGGGQPDGPRFLFFDRVEVKDSSGDDIAVANADFSDTGELSREDFFSVQVPYPDDDQGPIGWHITDMENDQYADPVPGGVLNPSVDLPEGMQFDAHSGDRVWRWQALGPDFGDDNLDQCFAIDASGNTDFNFVVWARTAEDFEDAEVVRLGVQFFADLDDCLVHGDNEFDFQTDFALPEVDDWLPLFTEIATPSGGDTVVRISLRARDPAEATGAAIYFDTVMPWSLQQPILTFDGQGEVADGDMVTVEVPGAPSGGVAAHFTVDGSMPTTASPSVTPGGMINLQQEDADSEGNLTLTVAAFKDGWNTSSIATATFTFEEAATDPGDDPGNGDEPVTVAAPEFDPAPGSFEAPVTVTLTSASEGANIFYTLDGSTPTTDSESVDDGGTVTIDETATLRAIAVIDDDASAATTGEYTITIAEEEPAIAAPELSPPGGTFVGSVTVTLSSDTEDAIIRFTTDGSDPTGDSDSVENSGMLTFEEDTELRAAAEVDGELSAITTGSYEIQEGVADDTLANGSFGELNPRAQTVSYPQRGGPPGWRLVVEARGENDGGTVETDDAFAGEASFSFNQLSEGFSDNKLEQCVPIDASRRVDISYRVRADTPDDDASGLRVRINPNFFESFEDCITAVAQDSGGSRLSDGRNNDDVDFDLGSRGNEWILRSPAEDSDLRYEVADLPEGTTWMRMSVRNRDRSGIDPAPRMRMDDIRVIQGTSTVNLLVNGSFEQIELRDRDFLSGGSGWFVDRNDDDSRRAAAGPVDFALVGSNVFFFEDLSEDFGDSRLDQCVALDGETLQPAAFVRTGEPDADLSLRINADFYASADCEGDADSDLRIREDFDLDIAANEWVNFATDESRSADDYGDTQSVLLSLRMRDRSGLAAASSTSGNGMPRLGASDLSALQNGNGGGGSLSRRVFIDSVSLVSGAAVPEPDPTPDPDEPPVDVDPDPTPDPGPLRSSGCSASGQPGPFDPTLWVLALVAGLALFRRRRPKV
ncbi:MAG: JDVT-CTERM domain-containing protein, partial [Gammaproteobacteria bacterium]